MRKLLAIVLSLLLILTLVGCGEPEEMPICGFYSGAGAIEIYDVSIDNTLGSDAVKYIKVHLTFINTTDDILFMSSDNIFCYYDNEVVEPVYMDNVKYLPIDPVDLNPKVSHSGYLWYKIPIDVKNIRIECATQQGFGIFTFNV
jgi:hypothetical protein